MIYDMIKYHLYIILPFSLFYFYINNIQNFQANSIYNSLNFQSKDLSRVNEALNEDLSRLDAWLVSNKLSLNVAKTKSMLVSTKAKGKTLNKSNQNLQVNINGTELEVVSKIKLLGVLLDNSLDWKEQVQAVSLKVSRGLGILKHAKKFLPFSALTSLYTSIVEPISDTVAQCGAVLVLLREIVCKSCKTGLLDL